MIIKKVRDLRQMCLDVAALCEDWEMEAAETEAERKRGWSTAWGSYVAYHSHGSTRLSGDLKRRMMDLQRLMVEVRKAN